MYQVREEMPSWIPEQHDLSKLNLHLALILPTKTGYMVWEMFFEEFQDGCHGDHPGNFNGTMLANLNLYALMLRPSGGIFYRPFRGGASFVDLLCFFCLVFVMPLCASVRLCLMVTCWERADLLALVCGVSLSHWYPGSDVILDCINS